MKIRVKYYGQDEFKAPLSMTVEVQEGECELMIERDYEERKQMASEGEFVTRRSAQEIMDAEFNRPLYNEWHREHRRRSEFPDYQDRDEKNVAMANPIESVPDTYSCTIAGGGCCRNRMPIPDMGSISRDEAKRNRKAEYDDVCQMIRTVLAKKPEWADAAIAIYINGESVREYARRIGANENNITQKLKRAKEKFKKFFQDRQI
jgi:DNA-directed RNA polymerase specialized sigma24 family protein